MDIKRGDIYLADFSQGGKKALKPVLVVQNDMGNKYSGATIVVQLPDFLTEKLLPTHVAIPAEASKLGRDTVALTENLATVDKNRMKKFITRLSDEYMEEIDRALKISLSLD